MAKLFWKGKKRLPRLKVVGFLLEAGLLQVYWWTVRPLAVERASASGRRLFGWLGPKLEKHQRILANLRMAFPNKPPEEIAALAKKIWENFGAVLAEFPHLPAITDLDRVDPAIEIVCDPQFPARKRPCIFIAAHMGNWELSAFAIQHLGFPVDVVYSPLENPYMEKMIQRLRAPLGCGFIAKEKALRSMTRSLKAGRSVGLHVDVRVDEGANVPLFGIDTPTTEAPAWLAQKLGCEIVPVRTQRLGDARFRVILYPPLSPPAPGAEAIYQTTAAINRVVADLIAADPGQWWCGRLRWPKSVLRARGFYPASSPKRSWQ